MVIGNHVSGKRLGGLVVVGERGYDAGRSMDKEEEEDDNEEEEEDDEQDEEEDDEQGRGDRERPLKVLKRKKEKKALDF